MLNELAEEWERCENKVREIRIWMGKERSNLESIPSKRKPLRDQLASRETLLGEIDNQRVKVALSLDKLEVHFNSGVGSDGKIRKEVEELQEQLDDFKSQVKRLATKLENSLEEIDKLEEVG